MSFSFEDLSAHIVERSVADTFTAATKEWDVLGYTDRGDMSGTCPCGEPIRFEFEIRNRHTRATTHVGSVCVVRFGKKMEKMAEAARKRVTHAPCVDCHKMAPRATGFKCLYADKEPRFFCCRCWKKYNPCMHLWGEGTVECWQPSAACAACEPTVKALEAEEHARMLARSEEYFRRKDEEYYARPCMRAQAAFDARQAAKREEAKREAELAEIMNGLAVAP